MPQTPLIDLQALILIDHLCGSFLSLASDSLLCTSSFVPLHLFMSITVSNTGISFAVVVFAFWMSAIFVSVHFCHCLQGCLLGCLLCLLFNSVVLQIQDSVQILILLSFYSSQFTLLNFYSCKHFQSARAFCDCILSQKCDSVTTAHFHKTEVWVCTCFIVLCSSWSLR